MAKKAPHQRHAPAPLEPRIRRAIHEGRFQQALELAKQLHKQEPNPAHLELLKNAYLGRAKQLREQNYGRDASAMLEAALRIDEASPAWIERIARETAQAGAVRQALALLDRLPPETPSLATIRDLVVDAAVQQEAAGREQLPPALQQDYDRIVLAFQQAEQGQDEAARATMQEIGLRSPFLEWKVLLRGFQAYYQNDDARALENWQRLNAERLPVRLAAPFRCQIDPAYQASQPPATQKALQNSFDRGQGSVLQQELRRLQQSMGHQESLAQAFRQAEKLLPQLKQEAPQLAPRLAACFYWAAIDIGPDEVARYSRVFGPPPLDPHFHRLHALGYDRGRDAIEAHPHWQAYERELAQHPEIFPNGQATAARALIWLHMGRNAATMPSKKLMDKLPRFLRDHPDRPRPLNPSPEFCFEKSIELGPEQLEPYEELFKYFVAEENHLKAAKAAKRLLERFPDHVPTLTTFGDICLKEEKYKDALDLFQRALRASPLDRGLRRHLSAAHMFQARADLEAERLDEARRHYQEAMSFEAEINHWSIHARWAAGEFKAGNAARAEELLELALAKAPHPLVVSFRMLTEAIRLKLPKALKTRFEMEYKAGLASPPNPEAVANLIEFLADLKVWGVTYTGMKTHETAILKYAGKGQQAAWDARQIESVVCALLRLEAFAPARRFLTNASRRFRNDPVFPILEASIYLLEGPSPDFPHVRVRTLLENANHLAQALPPDENRAKLLEEIHRLQQMLDAFNPFGALQNIFGGMFDFGEEFDDDDDDFDDDDDIW